MVVFISKSGEAIEKRPLQKVTAFYAEDKYVLARFDDGSDEFVHHLANERGEYSYSGSSTATLKSIFAFLSQCGQDHFKYVNRSHVVDMNKVKELVIITLPSGNKGKALKFSGGFDAAVSRRYHSRVKRLFMSSGISENFGAVA